MEEEESYVLGTAGDLSQGSHAGDVIGAVAKDRAVCGLWEAWTFRMRGAAPRTRIFGLKKARGQSVPRFRKHKRERRRSEVLAADSFRRRTSESTTAWTDRDGTVGLTTGINGRGHLSFGLHTRASQQAPILCRRGNVLAERFIAPPLIDLFTPRDWEILEDPAEAGDPLPAEGCVPGDFVVSPDATWDSLLKEVTGFRWVQDADELRADGSRVPIVMAARWKAQTENGRC